jgi:hypothetical protein
MRVRTVIVIVELRAKVPFFGVLPIRAGASAEFDPIAWLGPDP